MDCQRLVDSFKEPRLRGLSTLPLTVEALRAVLAWLSAASEPSLVTVLNRGLSANVEILRAYASPGRAAPGSVPGAGMPAAARRKGLSSLVGGFVNTSISAMLRPS